MNQFFSALFDLSFKKFSTPQLVSYIYVITIVCVGIKSVMLLRTAGSFGVILAPVMFLAGVVYARAILELVLAVFQIARYSAEVARRGRPQTDDNMEEVEAFE